MFIRALVLFVMAFSFGQSSASECPDVGRVVDCSVSFNGFVFASGLSQGTNGTYTFVMWNEEDRPGRSFNIVTDGKTRAISVERNDGEYTATCVDGTLRIKMTHADYDAIVTTFTKGQGGVLTTMEIVGQTPVLRGSCSLK